MSDQASPTNEPFHFHHTKGGLVRISCAGKLVKTLAGKAAAQFLDRVAAADPEGRQRIMAKATGQFRFGNERLAREKSRRP